MTQARLVLEHAPTAQAVTEVAYHGGQFTIGRGDDADWSISDPDKFVSRKHFVLSEEDGTITVTDASSGGLFVDGSATALGVGNSTPLEDGMRLRFGDFVLRVELASDASKAPQAAPAKPSSSFEFTFDPIDEPVKPQERPKELPEPFGVQKSSFFDRPEEKVEKPPEPLDREDPFALNLKPSSPNKGASGESSGFFDATKDTTPTPRERQRDRPSNSGEYFKTSIEAETPEPTPNAVVEPVVAPAPDLATAKDAALRAAFFKGLGLDPDKFGTSDQVAEMEALGKRFRALTDGLVHLLRNRAEERQKVRVAQTIIGSANVNPLKFAVSTDDAVSSLIAERGAGYLDPDTSISDSYRDLIDHQMRTWTALQSALRQMIDKFDPAEIEKEMAETGLLEALIAGGKSAKLWQLYEERYQEIAQAAEERFLGEIGGDFRDAYESKGKGRS